MSDGDGLPKGWAKALVEQVVRHDAPVMYGILQPGPDVPDGIPYVRPTEIEKDVIQVESLRRTTPAIAQRYKRSTLSANDVILSIVGTIGKVAIVPETLTGANITQSSARIRPTPSAITPQFLAWLLRSPELRNQYEKVRLGTAVPRLNIAHVRALELLIAPLNEQRRIVAKIEELFSDLDAGVAALERVKANLKRYRASVLKAAVEGRLTAEWRAKHHPKETGSDLLARILKERRRKWEEDQHAAFAKAGKEPPKNWQARYKEPAAPDASNLPDLPSGWCWASVQQIGKVQLGRQRSPQHHVGPHMRPYLRVANVFEDRIDTTDVMEMNFTPEEYEVYRLQAGDILLNEGQSMELVGRPAIYRDEVPGACFTNTLVRFQSASGLDTDYALTVFLTYLKNGRFQKIATITVNIAHLGAGRFAELEFPLPPAAEQRQIVAEVNRHLSVIQAIEAQIDANLKRASRLRQSILKRAFEGKLVPQDPKDEPAEALLRSVNAAAGSSSHLPIGPVKEG